MRTDHDRDNAEGTDGSDAGQCWDREYADGRYLDEPPVAFVDDILAAARAVGARRGLYIGCGNGRDYIPRNDRETGCPRPRHLVPGYRGQRTVSVCYRDR